MKTNSPTPFISWVAAIAFIMAYLFIVNPWVNNLGVSQANAAVVLARDGAISEILTDTPQGVSIHTQAGVLVIGGNSIVTAQALDDGHTVYRLGSIVFVPSASQDF